MIKPVNITENIIRTADKLIKAAASETKPETAAEPVQSAGADVLRAYRGISTGKLFDSFEEFFQSTKIRLDKLKEDEFVSEPVYKILSEALEAKDFSLGKKVSKYYSGLKDCKTLVDVRNAYPEITLPEKTPLEITTNEVKWYISKKTCETFKSIPDVDVRNKFFDGAFDNVMSDQIKKSDAYPEILKIRDSIKEEIQSGKFDGYESLKEAYPYAVAPSKYGNTPQVSIITRLLQTDYNNVMLEILKQHYIEGKNLSDIVVKTPDFDFYALRIKKQLPFGIIDKNLRKFIDTTEKTAAGFKELGSMSSHDIKSEIMTRTWQTSHLRADLGNMTKFGKPWSIVRAVWQKSMFPETTFYPTDKLIDAYLLNLFKNRKFFGLTQNPIAKYATPFLDKNKVMLLKRLYSMSKDLNADKKLLESTSYKEFKSKFNIDEMAKSIESIEAHYKNVFFKKFWTDERKLRFSQALHQNKELANTNIKISEEILTDAMNKIFAEQAEM